MKDLSLEEVSKNLKEIYEKDLLVGYAHFTKYHQDKKDYLGLSNFIILPSLQQKGYGTRIIKDLILHNNDTYDDIYCWVSKDNIKAINFYKTIGPISKNLHEDLIYVTLYKKRRSQMNQDKLFTEFGLFDSSHKNKIEQNPDLFIKL